jgi:ubiquinone/menaquinone biosynthesis C-methylase UbiE
VNITIDAYNKHAAKYFAKFAEFEPYRQKMTLFQKTHIRKDAQILDLGCGPGNNARFLLELDGTYKITGVDLSAEMINLAREQAPGCQFLVQDIRDIRPGRTYDTVVASFCIVHLTDDEATELLRTVSLLLKENGTLYLSFMEGKNPGIETTSFSIDGMFFNYFQRGQIREMLSRFSIEVIETLTEAYEETDGSFTEDVFIFARSSSAAASVPTCFRQRN